MTALEALGWRPELADALAAAGGELTAARVVLAERGAYRVGDGEVESPAVVTGRLLADGTEDGSGGPDVRLRRCRSCVGRRIGP